MNAWRMAVTSTALISVIAVAGCGPKEPPGPAAARRHSPAGLRAGAGAVGVDQAGDGAYAAALLGHPPAGGRHGSADAATAAGPQQPADHGPLPARQHATAAADAQPARPAGVASASLDGGPAMTAAVLARPGLEVAECSYQPHGWPRPYRFVVARKSLLEEETAQNKLFPLGRYTYHAFVTNL